MKKFLLIFLFILIFAPYSLGEGFPPKGGRDEYPIYWYLHRHGERLMKELNTRKFFRLHGWSCNYLVKITRDGDVIPLKIVYSQNKLYDNQIKKIIATTKAEPFDDEIQLDEMVIEIILGYADWGDVLDILYNPQKNNSNERYTIFVQTTH